MVCNGSSMSVMEWSSEDIKTCLKKEDIEEDTIRVLCDENKLDGKCLLMLNDADFSLEPLSKLTLRDRKKLYFLCKTLQRENQSQLIDLGLLENHTGSIYTSPTQYNKLESEYGDSERISPPISEDGRPRYPSEKTKAFLSFLYVVAVTWITAFVMVIVHDRVPDMKKYPPLPDIFLDNVPHIPWAFDMCEVTGTILFTIWLILLLFHKHRYVFIFFIVLIFSFTIVYVISPLQTSSKLGSRSLLTVTYFHLGKCLPPAWMESDFLQLRCSILGYLIKVCDEKRNNFIILLMTIGKYSIVSRKKHQNPKMNS